MKVITQIEQLLALPGRNIGFFGDPFNPLQFAHLNFIKKAIVAQNLNHVVICPQTQPNEREIINLNHRMRIMDLMAETVPASEVFILSHEACNRAQNKFFIDDIFYCLKRQNKNIYVLVGCDSLKQSMEFYKSTSVTFIVGCKTKHCTIGKQRISKNIDCIFIDDSVPLPSGQIINNLERNNSYLSEALLEYIESNKLYSLKKNCANCN